MFKVENNVPQVYTEESRDFQLLSRLYDLVLQSTQYSVMSLRSVSDTIKCNDTLLPLVASKVGFFNDLELTDRANRMFLQAFPEIIRHKGSYKAIELIINLFERISNSEVQIDILPDAADWYGHTTRCINLTFFKYAPDNITFRSIIEYVRPAGMRINYTFVDQIEVSEADTCVDEKIHVNAKLTHSQSATIYRTEDIPEENCKQDNKSELSTAGAVGFVVLSHE